jgi:enoyl-[acyl-carrier protein] reductase III
MSQFHNKNLTALVTGGSRGIGRVVSLRLAGVCAQTVIVNYLQNDREAEKTSELVQEQNARCILAKANLAYPEEIDLLFEMVKANVDHLDILVHCAALGAFKPLMEIKPNQWDLTMNINARGFLLCIQNAVPLMKAGKIVAISSLGSHRVVPRYGAMGPTKAALESLIRYLAYELAPSGIQVNGVTAGLIQTDSINKFPEADKHLEEAILRTPQKRLGQPQDIADVVMFLLSPSARWICGQVIVADGGLSLV